MRFIDEVDIQVRSGKGGDGCVSFRREKFIPKGGPDGGHGGQGGHVLIRSDGGINTLAHYRGAKHFKAQDGDSGSGREKNGRAGRDMVLKVPVGTLIRTLEGRQIIADLREEEQEVLIVRGGRGGLGNSHFKTSTNRSPRYAQKGGEGVELNLRMELKLLADLALVGMPNAGKSTLISTVSGARPKVADYPFTTLAPQLGVVEIGEKSLVLADIPGLVERAHRGKGLGIHFLKHIERAKALVHLVDLSQCLEEYEAFERYVTVRRELSCYSSSLEEKRELICLTKVDAVSEETVEKYRCFFTRQLKKNVLPISAVSGTNIRRLKNLMLQML
ncbi:MAG: GTPase ObgE [Bacteriovoracales bacterium]|nr:GTPase ObgE [Bacteriovoracales bacterium]